MKPWLTIQAAVKDLADIIKTIGHPRAWTGFFSDLWDTLSEDPTPYLWLILWIIPVALFAPAFSQ